MSHSNEPKFQIAAVSLVLALLFLPWAVDEFSNLDQAKLFYSNKQCGHSVFYDEISSKEEIIDLAIVGSSDSARSINSGLLSKTLSKNSGQNIRVVNFSCANAGHAYMYSLVKTLLEKKKVRFLAIELMDEPLETNRREPFAYYWWMNFREADLLSSLSFWDRFDLYAESVYGGLVKLMLSLKPEDEFRIIHYVTNDDSQSVELNYAGDFDKDIKSFDSSTFVFGSDEQIDENSHSRNLTLSAKQKVFLSGIKMISETKDTKLILLNALPPPTLISRAPLPNNLPVDLKNVPVISIPEQYVMRGVDLQKWESTLRKDKKHRNQFGRDLFTVAASHSFLKAFEFEDEK